MDPIIRDNVFLREIYESAYAEGKAQALREFIGQLRPILVARFGRLPKWATARLLNAILPEAKCWAKTIFAADTLEGVLGRR